MNLDVVDFDGQKVGTISLSDAVFKAPVRDHVLWEVVQAQRAGWRRGTHSTKTRSEVAGSTKKIYRQKGTGRARHGNIRAPIFVGGGRAHRPRPRDYGYRPPKKVRRSALRAALSLRIQEGNVVVVRELTLPRLRTKGALERLGKIGAASSLIVEQPANEVFVRSVRNLANVKCLAPEGVNVYDILRYPRLVLTPETAKAIEARLS